MAACQYALNLPNFSQPTSFWQHHYGQAAGIGVKHKNLRIKLIHNFPHSTSLCLDLTSKVSSRSCTKRVGLESFCLFFFFLIFILIIFMFKLMISLLKVVEKRKKKSRTGDQRVKQEEILWSILNSLEKIMFNQPFLLCSSFSFCNFNFDLRVYFLNILVDEFEK
jgi:hypothetical protein